MSSIKGVGPTEPGKEPKKREEKAPLERLPQELFDSIVHQLPMQDRSALAKTSRTLNKATIDKTRREKSFQFRGLVDALITVLDKEKYASLIAELQELHPEDLLKAQNLGEIQKMEDRLKGLISKINLIDSWHLKERLADEKNYKNLIFLLEIMGSFFSPKELTVLLLCDKGFFEQAINIAYTIEDKKERGSVVEDIINYLYLKEKGANILEMVNLFDEKKHIRLQKLAAIKLSSEGKLDEAMAVYQALSRVEKNSIILYMILKPIISGEKRERACQVAKAHLQDFSELPSGKREVEQAFLLGKLTRLLCLNGFSEQAIIFANSISDNKVKSIVLVDIGRFLLENNGLEEAMPLSETIPDEDERSLAYSLILKKLEESHDPRVNEFRNKVTERWKSALYHAMVLPLDEERNVVDLKPTLERLCMRGFLWQAIKLTNLAEDQTFKESALEYIDEQREDYIRGLCDHRKYDDAEAFVESFDDEEFKAEAFEIIQQARSENQ